MLIFLSISLFLPHVKSQLRIQGDNERDIAIRTWNAQWDVLLLGALFEADVGWNLESIQPADSLTPQSPMRVTNYHLRGSIGGNVYHVSDEDVSWLDQNYKTAEDLMRNDAFTNAVHCLATSGWHSMPRARLAIIWSGIEGLFKVEAEIVFRVSLYTARFLETTDRSRQSEIFKQVKALYKHRSKAVHGSKMNENSREAVRESALLLRSLIRRCAELGALPDAESLAP